MPLSAPAKALVLAVALVATLYGFFAIPAPARAQGCATPYRVRAGDTLWSIASRMGLSVETLKAQNGLQNETIYAGQQLCLSVAPGQCTQHHTIRPGETLSGLASRYKSSVATLMRWNGLVGPTIYAGQSLCVAVGSGGPAPLPATPTPTPETLSLAPGSAVAIEAHYTTTLTLDEIDSLAYRPLRLRAAYALDPDRFETITQTDGLTLAALTVPDRLPALWLVRYATDTANFGLLAVGDAHWFEGLRLTDTQRLTESLAVANTVLCRDGASDLKPLAELGDVLVTRRRRTVFPTELNLWLESPANLHANFPVDRLGYLPPDQASRSLPCSSGTILVVMSLHSPDPDGRFAATLILDPNAFPTGGVGRAKSCAAWRGARGWYRFLSNWYGCPRR